MENKYKPEQDVTFTCLQLSTALLFLLILSFIKHDSTWLVVFFILFVLSMVLFISKYKKAPMSMRSIVITVIVNMMTLIAVTYL